MGRREKGKRAAREGNVESGDTEREGERERENR